ncbi:MAG: hypothetical protein KDA21_03040 [Phycisphaerales bacterium]|nr:hypothetical protein [Phycisphaerales bacterium]
MNPTSPDMVESSTGPAPGTGVLCPYCGLVQSSASRCVSCRGLFEPLSRQATQNAMGAWQIRSERRPFQPGCSWETLRDMVARGRIQPDTVLRGPTTRQFWTFARDTPGIAVLLGICHSCHGSVARHAEACPGCGVELLPRADRQFLGLSPIQLLPGDAPAEQVATVAVRGTSGLERPASPPALHREREVAAAATAAPGRDGQDDERPGLVRRLRRDAARTRRTLLVSMVVNLVLVGAVVVGAVWFLGTAKQQRAEKAAAPEAILGASVPESDASAEVVPAELEADSAATLPEAAPAKRTGLIPGLDPGLERFSPDYLRAMELREEGSEESLSQAVELLEGILEDAEAEAAAFDGVQWPELERTLRDVRAELEEAVLRKIF